MPLAFTQDFPVSDISLLPIQEFLHLIFVPRKWVKLEFSSPRIIFDLQKVAKGRPSHWHTSKYQFLTTFTINVHPSERIFMAEKFDHSFLAACVCRTTGRYLSVRGGGVPLDRTGVSCPPDKTGYPNRPPAIQDRG